VGVRIRSATSADAALLREYLRLAIHVLPGEDPPPPSTVDRPDLAVYVDGWGRYGDDGVFAVDDTNGSDLGAAWLRLWPGPESGYGYVDRATPELAIAVRPDHRGRGIGACLLDALLARAAGRHRGVSLSVSRDNRAVRLYERFGFAIVGDAGASMTMLRRLVAIVFVVGALPLIAAAAQPPMSCAPDARGAAAVRQVATGIIDADNRRDLERVMAFYAPDAVLLPPNSEPVIGAAAIRPRYAQLFEDLQPRIESRIDEVCVGTSIAFVRGVNHGRMEPRTGAAPGRELSDAYLMVLTRGAGGAWRISRLMWHGDRPIADR
jgi:uncharacterized protein (TIGR02246 family)